MRPVEGGQFSIREYWVRKGQNGVYTHSVNWDNSAASHDTDMNRHSMEGSAQVPQFGRAVMDSSMRLGALFFHFLWVGA